MRYINSIDIKPSLIRLGLRLLEEQQADIRDFFPRVPTSAEALAGCMVLD